MTAQKIIKESEIKDQILNSSKWKSIAANCPSKELPRVLQDLTAEIIKEYNQKGYSIHMGS